ncbi:MAG TPA: hypothetical protein VFX79_00905 [Candidatus Saccharimonadales bacterium]|nr:hypothetical protein [Candidatus Saccharimonadales bacterium]
MDIKPVKKRRRQPVGNLQNLPNANQPKKQDNITVNSKHKPLNRSSKTMGKKRLRLKKLLQKNIFVVIILILLSILYLPASKFIGTSGQYQDLVGQSSSTDVILSESSYMPQKFFLYFTHSSGLSSEFMLKIYSFLFILLVVYLFYIVCLRWLGRNTALLTTLLFSSSSWMILSSQSLDFNNIYLVFIPLAICLNYLLAQNKNTWKLLFAGLLFAATLYSPGIIWSILGFIILLPFFMQKILEKYDLRKIWMLLAIIFVTIIPLFVSFVLYPDNFAHILAGDSQTTVSSFTQNLQASLEALFLNGIPDSNLWLVGTPIFNYLSCLLLVFGLVALFVDKRLKHRFDFLAVSLIFAVLALTFVGLPALSLIIPIVYLTAGYGIKFLLDNWYSIFPSNPVARNLGLSLVVFTVVLSSGYNIVRYYVAWPKTNDIISVAGSEKTI